MEKIFDAVVNIVWSPALVILLFFAGLYFSVRTRFVQVRKFRHMVRLLFGEGRQNGDGGSMSSFQAFWVALAGRVGIGNIVGVATAIALGGPGAVFWMWLMAFLGASTAFTESTLANKYKFYQNGTLQGGPATYISIGLKSPFFASLFAIFTILGYGMFSILVQANGISEAIGNSFHVSHLIVGIIVAVAIGIVIMGGVRRIAQFATIVTPFMAIIYILMSIVVIVVNIEYVPQMFKLIFSSAFGVGPVFSGIMGSTIAMGVKRGLFSNEAGQGGGAIISASTNVSHPAKQGLVQAFSVYIDTLLVCSATAFMILSTGCYNVFDASGNAIIESAPELGKNYVGYTQSAIDSVFMGFGGVFVSISLTFFAFTTIIAYYYYAKSSFLFLFRNNKNAEYYEKVVIRLYQFVLLALVVIGSITLTDVVWKFGDIGIGLAVWINVVALIFLFPKALELLKEYDRK